MLRHWESSLLKLKMGMLKFLDENIERKTHKRFGVCSWRSYFLAAYYAFAQACNFGNNVAVAVQVSINFLKPSVEGDVLTAEATRVSDGKTTGLYHVTVMCGEKLVAFFSGLAFKK